MEILLCEFVSFLFSIFSLLLIYLSFVDRDIYMRYRRGGVGHSFLPIADHEPEIEVSENNPGEDDTREDAESDDNPNLKDWSGNSGDSGSDVTSEASGNEEDTTLEDNERVDSETDEDFDPEDGEGNILDIENEEGFGEL